MGTAGAGGGLRGVAQSLAAMGDAPVMTDKGRMTAREAAKLLLAGVVRDVRGHGFGVSVTPSGVFAYGLGQAPGKEPSPLLLGDASRLAKLADELASLGVELGDLSRGVAYTPEAVVSALVAELQRSRGFARRRLRSILYNLLDLVAGAVSSAAGDDPMYIANQIERLGRSGDFHAVVPGAREGRIHAPRTAINMATGSLRRVMRVYAESGRRYVILVDKSGSMSAGYNGVTTYGIALLALWQIAYSDPTARFTVIAFDTRPYVAAVGAGHEEAADSLADILPGGGTSYEAALKAATEYLRGDDVLVVIGDFHDAPGFARRELPGEVVSKTSKRILVPVGAANAFTVASYARILGAEVYVYRRGALVRADVLYAQRGR